MNVDKVLSQANLSSLGCTGHWSCNGNMRDSSGNSKHLTEYNITYSKCKDGKYCAVFDGSSSYATIAESLHNTGVGTLMMWYYLPSLPAATGMIWLESSNSASNGSGEGSGSSANDFNIWQSTTSTCFTFECGADTSAQMSYTTTKIGEWVHIAITWEEDVDQSLYENCIIRDQETGEELAITTFYALTNIGRSFSSGEYRYLNFMAKDILLFDTKLSESTIKEFQFATYIE